MGPILLSTAYFPPVSWFAHFLQASDVFMEACETYPKQTYRNRCHLYASSGVQALSIPVVKPFGNSTRTHQVLLDDSQHWLQQHWRSIKTFYSKTPYYIHYSGYLEPLFVSPKHKTLLEFNDELIRLILKLLKCQKTYTYTGHFEHTPENCSDLRQTIHPKKGSSLLFPRYIQTFEPKYGFIPNLSILDLLFNQGPESVGYLNALIIE